jgi:hypothetical protein
MFESNVRAYTNEGTNTYYEHSYITDVKGFITLRPGANVIKLFLAVIYEFL